jgi:hypothetical protein
VKHSRDFDCTSFARDLKAEGLNDKLNDIDILTLVAEPHFTPEFRSKATELAMKQFLRKLMREGFEDEDGETIRAFKIVVLDPETGQPKEGYKQKAFWVLDDYEYLINDVRRHIGADTRKLRNLCREAVELFGFKAVQARFPFKLPIGRESMA